MGGVIPGGWLLVRKEMLLLKTQDHITVMISQYQFIRLQSCVNGDLLLLWTVTVCTFKDLFGHLVQDNITSLLAPTFSEQPH